MYDMKKYLQQQQNNEKDHQNTSESAQHQLLHTNCSECNKVSFEKPRFLFNPNIDKRLCFD